MGYQFIHIEAYGDRVPAKAPDKLTMAEVAEENERQPDAVPHVLRPTKPYLVYGMMPVEVVALAREHLDKGKTRVGEGLRKLRADANLVVAGVVSQPFTSAEIRSNIELFSRYLCWEKDTVEWLQKRYGMALRSVVRHQDEKHFHLHFWVLDGLERQGDVDIIHGVNRVHDGYGAKKKAREAGATKKEQDRQYKAAMRAYQDSYYLEVGIRHGLARTGPKRRRLSRREWQEEKAQGLATQEATMHAAKLARDAEEAKQLTKLAQQEMRRVNQETMIVEAKLARQEQQQWDLQVREAWIKGREHDLAIREAHANDNERDINRFIEAVESSQLDPDTLKLATRQADENSDRVQIWLARLSVAVSRTFSTVKDTLRKKLAEVDRVQGGMERKSKSARALYVAVGLFGHGKLWADKNSKGWRVTEDVSPEDRYQIRHALTEFPEQFMTLNTAIEKVKTDAVAAERKRIRLLEEKRRRELEELKFAREALARHSQVLGRHLHNLPPELQIALRLARNDEYEAARIIEGQSR